MTKDPKALVKEHLKFLRATGDEFVPAIKPKQKKAVNPTPTVSTTASPVKSAAKAKVAISKPLEALRKEVAACQKCEELACGRTNIVFGDGSPGAKLVFVGEAPGAEEDKQGIPFVGRAGQLLTKMIEAMGLSREEVFICNVLKCRPPENRNPLPAEIMNCEPYLLRQLEILKPKVICALGTFAARALLKNEDTISSMRGRFFDYHGVKLMPTFHPAYLLRNGSQKKVVWGDLQLIMEELGLK